MNPQMSPSEVRAFERYRCSIRASISVAHGHSDKVTVSRQTGDGSGLFPGVIVDCSTGGFALETGTFLPRAARARVTVDIPDEAPIELDVGVKRATMVSRKPMYNLGVSIVEPVADQERAVRRLLSLARASAVPGAAAGPAQAAGGAPGA